MIRVGVIGLGMMGSTHLDAYAKRDDVAVLAVADKDPKRLSGEESAKGNIEGQAQGGFDLNAEGLRKYDEASALIADADVDLVDICLVTPLHTAYAVEALQTGKHVLIEKPLARTYKDAMQIVEAARAASGFSMCAMCMRFWPGWDWLKQRVAEKTYGDVLSISFRRVADHPGGPFYADGEANGGAALDLHIHDTDFVQHLFGVPKRVSSVGYSKVTSGVDHLTTCYEYDTPGRPMVTAEGGWAMAKGFPFSMRYAVNFEGATAVYDLADAQPLTVYEPDQAAQAVSLAPEMGYDLEIAYFLSCISKGEAPSVVTLEDAANAVRIVEAEIESVQTNRPVTL